MINHLDQGDQLALVFNQRYLLTCAHILRGSIGSRVYRNGIGIGKLAARLPEFDCALVALDHPVSDPQPEIRPAALGDATVAGKEAEITQLDGHVRVYDPTTFRVREFHGMLLLDADVKRGDSGSLVLQDGAVVGMLIACCPAVAVPLTIALAHLARNDVALS